MYTKTDNRNQLDDLNETLQRLAREKADKFLAANKEANSRGHRRRSKGVDAETYEGELDSRKKKRQISMHDYEKMKYLIDTQQRPPLFPLSTPTPGIGTNLGENMLVSQRLQGVKQQPPRQHNNTTTVAPLRNSTQINSHGQNSVISNQINTVSEANIFQ